MTNDHDTVTNVLLVPNANCAEFAGSESAFTESTHRIERVNFLITDVTKAMMLDTGRGRLMRGVVALSFQNTPERDIKIEGGRIRPQLIVAAIVSNERTFSGEEYIVATLARPKDRKKTCNQPWNKQTFDGDGMCGASR